MDFIRMKNVLDHAGVLRGNAHFAISQGASIQFTEGYELIVKMQPTLETGAVHRHRGPYGGPH